MRGYFRRSFGMRRFLATVLTVAFLAICAGQSSASTLTFVLNKEFSGGTAPSGPSPWLKVEFKDTLANQVTVTMTSLLSGPTEFVSGWYMNLDPTLASGKTGTTITGLSFAYVSGTAATTSAKVDNFKADGDGLYDILFAFPTSGSGQFVVGSTSVYTLTWSGPGTMDASSFDFLSKPKGGKGPFKTAAHVQGTGGGGQSGWISGETFEGGPGVPEPSTITLAVIGAVGGLSWYRRRISRR